MNYLIYPLDQCGLYEIIHYFAFSVNQNQCDSRYLLGYFIKNNSLFENLIFYMTEKKEMKIFITSQNFKNKILAFFYLTNQSYSIKNY